MRVLATFAAVNAALGWVRPELDGNWLWVNLSSAPAWITSPLMAGLFVGVVGYSLLGVIGRALALTVVATAAGACLVDTAVYYRLLWEGAIATSIPAPLSLPVAGCLLVWAARRRRELGGSFAAFLQSPRPQVDMPHGWMMRVMRPALLGAVMLGCLWLHLTAFGATDYRRPADAIVVFGAAVRADGEASLALYDRTRTGCDLYLKGYADRLVFSGGRDDRAPVSEPEAMRRIALSMGVPDAAIVLDERGVNSAATVANTHRLCRRKRWGEVLMVSHDYHLARIKLLSHRAGLRAYTVPADETRPLTRKAYYVCRELAAWLWWYAQPAAA